VQQRLYVLFLGDDKVLLTLAMVTCIISPCTCDRIHCIMMFFFRSQLPVFFSFKWGNWFCHLNCFIFSS
jgi:hypothetical protein